MAKFSQQFLANLGRPQMTESLFGLGAAIGNLPAQKRQAEILREQKERLAQMDQSTPQGLMQLAQYYQSLGDPASLQLALKYSEASRNLSNQQAEQNQIAVFQEQVARGAEKAGLTEQAASARSTTDMEELRAINEDIRTFQIEQLDLDNPMVIKARLQMAGFTLPQITALGTISADEADALLKGRTGKLEVWQDAQGNVRPVNVNDFGLVFDDQINKYVRASELGLVQKAPDIVKQIVDTSQQVGREKMAEANVNDFVKLHEKATNARDQIEILDRQVARLEGGMPTGLLATTELTLRRVGELLGMPYDPEVTKAQNYISEASKIVAEQIKDFGSGTGLSDADREYAKIGAGADIGQQAEALINLLNIRRTAMSRTVELYNNVRAATAKEMGAQNMTVYLPITMPQPTKKEKPLPEGFELDQ